ncbi:hypothetical protein [Bacteroides sp. 519]|uniref:hypothetical protein n=1 Tax=Bacteroides sp. 519 TaxID=2302937 RepID=UPI0013D02E79|nr:hypothetical protein [Bacteroides sp. 519]NDV58123.1 hypothetical protein [Bacteroides sp. 519]
MYRTKWLPALLLVFLLFSCNSEKTDNSTLWGETTYYSNFLFYKYDPVIMEKTLRLEFNNNARSVTGVKLGIFEKDDKDKLQPVKQGIRLYKNGEPCSGNEFTVSGNEEEARIGIEFLSDAREGIHKWYFKVIDDGGLDRINDSEISAEPKPVLLELRAKKADIWNPLALTFTWLLIILVAILLLWMLVLRNLVYPRFKVGAFTVTDPYYSMRRLRGCYKLVCTSKPVKQSALSKLFKGTVIYEVNPFWTKDWVIIPRDSSSIKPIGTPEYTFEPYTVSLRKATEYKVTNNKTGEKLILIIN